MLCALLTDTGKWVLSSKARQALALVRAVRVVAARVRPAPVVAAALADAFVNVLAFAPVAPESGLAFTLVLRLQIDACRV